VTAFCTCGWIGNLPDSFLHRSHCLQPGSVIRIEAGPVLTGIEKMPLLSEMAEELSSEMHLVRRQK
jgi:hypothetical protein